MNAPSSAREGRHASGLASFAASALGLVLSGCRASLPDGTVLWKDESEASVRAKLGTPDVVDQRTTNIGNVVFKDFEPVDRLFYFDRGYVFIFHEERLKTFRPISPELRAQVQQHEGPTEPLR